MLECQTGAYGSVTTEVGPSSEVATQLECCSKVRRDALQLYDPVLRRQMTNDHLSSKVKHSETARHHGAAVAPTAKFTQPLEHQDPVVRIYNRSHVPALISVMEWDETRDDEREAMPGPSS